MHHYRFWTIRRLTTRVAFQSPVQSGNDVEDSHGQASAPLGTRHQRQHGPRPMHRRSPLSALHSPLVRPPAFVCKPGRTDARTRTSRSTVHRALVQCAGLWLGSEPARATHAETFQTRRQSALSLFRLFPGAELSRIILISASVSNSILHILRAGAVVSAQNDRLCSSANGQCQEHAAQSSIRVCYIQDLLSLQRPPWAAGGNSRRPVVVHGLRSVASAGVLPTGPCTARPRTTTSRYALGGRLTRGPPHASTS